MAMAKCWQRQSLMTDSYDEQDRAADDAARNAQQRKQATQLREQKRMAGAMVTLLPKRDIQVLAWLCEATGKPPGEIGVQMIRQGLIQERRAFKEAMGGGGSSSTNLEELTKRLTKG